MCKISDRSESNSDGEFDVEDVYIKEATGWNEKTDFDDYIKVKNAGSHLIRLADEKFPLSSVIHNYNIHFRERYSPAGWNLEARCPFKDHQDTTPSFGYNVKDGIFNCFGCSRGGKTVKFLSYIENKTQLEVAKDLLRKVADTDDLIVELEDRDHDKVDDLYLEFSIEVNMFLQKHKTEKAFQYVEKITESLDLYLANNAMRAIDSVNFDARLNKLREYLYLFGD